MAGLGSKGLNKLTLSEDRYPQCVPPDDIMQTDGRLGIVSDVAWDYFC